MRTTKLGLVAVAAVLLNVACGGGSLPSSSQSTPGGGGADDSGGGDASTNNSADPGAEPSDCVAPHATEVAGDFSALRVHGDSLYMAEFDRQALTTTTYGRILKASAQDVSGVATAYQPKSRELQDYWADDAGLVVLEHARATSTDDTEAFAYRVPASGSEPVLIGPKDTTGYGDDARLFHVDANAVYIGTDKAFYRVDSRSGTETVIAEHGLDGLPRQLQVLGRDLWFKSGSTIYRVSLDGVGAIPQRVYVDGCLFDGAMQVTPKGIYCGGNVWLELLALDGSGRRKVDQPKGISLFLDPLGIDGSHIYLGGPNSHLYQLLIDSDASLIAPSILSCNGSAIDLGVTRTQVVWLAGASDLAEPFHLSLYAVAK